MPESDQQKWRGIRPTDPPENIPVEPGVSADIAKSGDADNNTVVIYTVTTGKILKITAFCLSIFNASGTDKNGTLSIRNASDVVQAVICNLHAFNNGNDSQSAGFAIPMSLPAGWDIAVFSSAAALEAHGFIAGYEIDA